MHGMHLIAWANNKKNEKMSVSASAIQSSPLDEPGQEKICNKPEKIRIKRRLRCKQKC